MRIDLEYATKDEYLNYEQAGEYAGNISHWTVRKWVRDGLLPAIRLGRLVRISRRDLDAFMAERRVGAV